MFLKADQGHICTRLDCQDDKKNNYFNIINFSCWVILDTLTIFENGDKNLAD